MVLGEKSVADPGDLRLTAALGLYEYIISRSSCRAVGE
jgi:hypothetical protein